MEQIPRIEKAIGRIAFEASDARVYRILPPIPAGILGAPCSARPDRFVRRGAMSCHCDGPIGSHDAAREQDDCLTRKSAEKLWRSSWASRRPFGFLFAFYPNPVEHFILANE